MSDNRQVTVGFDVDDTLIDEFDQPRWNIRQLLVTLHDLGCDVTVWSGGGADYAAMWGRRLFLPDGIRYEAKEKPTQIVDIAFDDEEVVYGKVNIKIPKGPRDA